MWYTNIMYILHTCVALLISMLGLSNLPFINAVPRAIDNDCGFCDTYCDALPITVEGADLAKEIAKKVNEDFDQKKLPLMLGMINAIVDDKKLELDWESFR